MIFEPVPSVSKRRPETAAARNEGDTAQLAALAKAATVWLLTWPPDKPLSAVDSLTLLTLRRGSVIRNPIDNTICARPLIVFKFFRVPVKFSGSKARFPGWDPGPGRSREVREAYRNNFHLVSSRLELVARCYDQKNKKVNDGKSNDYFNVSVRKLDPGFLGC